MTRYEKKEEKRKSNEKKKKKNGPRITQMVEILKKSKR